MLQPYADQVVSHTPLRAVIQLRYNIESLLRTRGHTQRDLAFFLKRHPTTINKFMKGTRELQFADLDKIADFFGLATYQLFQPGISPLTERRDGRERRSGHERRLSHVDRIYGRIRAEEPIRTAIAATQQRAAEIAAESKKSQSVSRDAQPKRQRRH